MSFRYLCVALLTLAGLTERGGAAGPPVRNGRLVCPILDDSWYRSYSPIFPFSTGFVGFGPERDHLQPLGQTHHVSPAIRPDSGLKKTARDALSRIIRHFEMHHADVVLLGRSHDQGKQIQIQQILYGSHRVKEKFVTIQPPDKVEIVAGQAVSRLYFLRLPEPGREVKAPLAQYEGMGWLPASAVDEVRTVLARREQYPLVRRKPDDPPGLYREILLDVSVDEAIDLLGTDYERVVGLAGRKLMLEPHQSLAKVVAAIEQRMFSLEEKTPCDHQRLMHLLTVLGGISTVEARQHRHRLLERLIDHILTDPPRATMVRKPNIWLSEDEYSDVNHALVWLLRELDGEDLTVRDRERLTQLRNQARGAWISEVELALDVVRFDDQIELVAAQRRMATIGPARIDATSRERPLLLSANGHTKRIEQVLFTAAGRGVCTVCAEGRLCVWDEQGRLLRSIQLPTRMQLLNFQEPEGKYLFFEDATQKQLHLVVKDSTTLTSLSSLKLPVKTKPEIYLAGEQRCFIRNGDQLLEYEYHQGKVLRQMRCRLPDAGYGEWDVTTTVAGQPTRLQQLGAPRMRCDLQSRLINATTGKWEQRETKVRCATCYGVVPGERTVWVAEAEQMRFLEQESLETKTTRVSRGSGLRSVSFSRDAARYALIEETWQQRERFLGEWHLLSPQRIRVHDRASGRTIAVLPSPTKMAAARLSPDGTRLVVVWGTKIELWQLPETF